MEIISEYREEPVMYDVRSYAERIFDAPKREIETRQLFFKWQIGNWVYNITGLQCLLESEKPIHYSKLTPKQWFLKKAKNHLLHRVESILMTLKAHACNAEIKKWRNGEHEGN